MARHRSDDERRRPLTLGGALVAHVRLIVNCKSCRRVELFERHGEALTVIDWAERLRCSECGEAECVVSGARR